MMQFSATHFDTLSRTKNYPLPPNTIKTNIEWNRYEGNVEVEACERPFCTCTTSIVSILWYKRYHTKIYTYLAFCLTFKWNCAQKPTESFRCKAFFGRLQLLLLCRFGFFRLAFVSNEERSNGACKYTRTQFNHRFGQILVLKRPRCRQCVYLPCTVCGRPCILCMH